MPQIRIDVQSASLNVEAIENINRALELTVQSWIEVLERTGHLGNQLGDYFHRDYCKKFSSIEEMFSILEEIKSCGDHIHSFHCLVLSQEISYTIIEHDITSPHVLRQAQRRLDEHKKRLVEDLENQDIEGAVRTAHFLLGKSTYVQLIEYSVLSDNETSTADS